MLIAIVELRFDWDKIIQSEYNTYEKVIFFLVRNYVITISIYIVSTWIFPVLPELVVWTNNFQFNI